MKNDLNTMIERVVKPYSYLISRDAFSSFVSKKIGDDFQEGDVQKLLFLYLERLLKSGGKNKQLERLSLVVNHYFQNHDFSGLDSFLRKIHYEVFPGMIVDFLNQDKKFSSYVQSFVLKNQEQICHGNIMEVCHSEFFSDVVFIYLDLHHIMIQDDFSDITPDDSQVLDNYNLYLQEVIRYPILSEEEEKSLGFQILEGDSDAIQTLARHNLRLVISIAKRYRRDGFSFMDFIQEGNFGLMKACRMFDVRKGYRFSTYATWWIRQSIGRYLDNNQGAYRLPVHVHDKLRDFRRQCREFQYQLDRIPTMEEMAHSFGMDVSEISEMLSLMNSDSISLQSEIGAEYDSTLEEFLIDEHRNTEKEAFDLMGREEMFRYFELAHLTEREKEVIQLRFGFYDGTIWKLREIAKKFHVTRERVRQIEQKSLQKMRSCRSAKYYEPDSARIKKLVLK